MKVLFYTGGFTHTMYREQARAAPDGVEFVASSADLHGSGIKADIANSDRAFYRAVRSGKRAVLEAIVRIGVPNVRYVQSRGCDIIHSAQYPLLNLTPWVVDFEDASVFAWYDPANLRRRHVRAVLERLFERSACRAILPWTHAAQDSLLHAVDCSKFSRKIHVVYPAIRPAERAERRERKELRLLFVGSAFYYKGGLETLLAFERVQRRLPVTLTMVSFVPNEVQARFRHVTGLTFRRQISPAEMKTLYQTSDLLVAPFHTDTFGFVILEAFAHGIPCVATDQFAIPEIVRDGVTGRLIANSTSRFGGDRLPRFSMLRNEAARLIDELITPPDAYISRLAAAIEQLADDRSALERMADNAFREVSEGRFSMARRRREIASVYKAGEHTSREGGTIGVTTP